MLGSRLWSELTQRQVATGSVPSSGGSGDGTGSGGSSQEITTIKSEIADIKSALNNVCGEDDVKSIVTTETAKLIGDTPPEDLDTLKELADAVSGNASSIAKLQQYQDSKMDVDDIRILSDEEFEALPDEERTSEFYVITDGPIESASS